MVEQQKNSKRENFIRLAENRTNNIIKTIQLLGNLSIKANYEYTQEEVNKIFKTIEEELIVAKNRFNGQKSTKDRFSLKK